MTRIAVSGAGGLIGSAVARKLAENAEVVSIGRRAEADLRCDFADPASVAALDLSGVDALIHCAGVVDEDFKADPQAAFRQATLGAAALFERAARGGVRRVAYISSAHVYGPMDGVIDEARPPDPRSDYAIAHFATEQTLKRSAGSFEACAAFRPNAVFGEPPSLAAFRRWTLIPFEFPRDAIASAAITLKSNGEQGRNFVASDDIAAAVAGWLTAGMRGYGAFNPVGRESMTVWDFAKLCAREAQGVTGRPVVLTRVETPGGKPAPFDYLSAAPFCQGDTSLSQTIAQLMRRIVADAAKGAAA